MTARNWDIYTGTEPPYEQPADILRRVQEFVAEVRAQHCGQRIALVTHGDVVMFMTLWAKGLPLTRTQKRPSTILIIWAMRRFPLLFIRPLPLRRSLTLVT